MFRKPRPPGRISRAVFCAGLVVALGASGPVPALADQGDAPGPLKAAGDKLGGADASLLAEAKAAGDKHVTLMVAAAPGATGQVAEQLDEAGASVGRTFDAVGYVRATVPTAAADRAIAAASRMSQVRAIDLREELTLPDPTPAADSTTRRATTTRAYPGPDRNTPATNPYQPAFETGAVDFVRQHPKADGRGVTIGVLDTGVDLAHPALQQTTTGERKIVDWVTATDPIVDGDATWRPMVTSVSGPAFTYNQRDYTAPAGSYQVSLFRESVTAGGDMAGDLNRDGDTTDSWAVLYDAAAGTVRVDLDDDGAFGDEEVMRPFRDGKQIGYFGTDDPSTAVAERIPFVVEIRRDVPMDPYGGDWVGKTADFVNVGVVQGAHGTHVAGITAANGLFGGRMNGAAPGAKVVSSRACAWNGGCTNVALTEGMIDLVVNRDVDVVNMSIGGLPALNDGANARARMYNELIDRYGVQLVFSAGNNGPGTNTIGDPAVADKVISVAASVSRETWAANYGSQVQRRYALFPFSSRGPREDGGTTPTLSAPGASINTVPTWQPGQPVPEAGYSLPPGYGMLQGTSMASPQATGAAALLLSAAKRSGDELTPARLRTALTSTARTFPGFQAHEQGAGLIDVQAAWRLLQRPGNAHTYTVQAPVSTALSELLTTPHVGTGIYDRESGTEAGKSRTYQVTLVRTSGPDRPVWHRLSFRNNDGSFRLGGPHGVLLPRDTPVKVPVVFRGSAGVHSTILEVDDLTTAGVDKQVMATVVVEQSLPSPSFTRTYTSSVQRNSTRSYFVRVPEGAHALEVGLDGLAGKSQTRFIAINPYGIPMDSSSSLVCYPNYPNPENTCRPDLRSYQNPIPGVWEIEVETRRTSPLLDNPFTLRVQALGVTFEPATSTVEEATPGEPAAVDWTVTNGMAPIDGTLRGGALGSSAESRPTIAQGETKTTTLTLGADVTRLEVAIGNTADTGADLDLSIYRDGVLVGQSADADSEEAVTLTEPAAGTYTFEVVGYSVPSGSTAYDHRDVYFAASLGSVNVDPDQRVKLDHGASAKVAAEVVVGGPAPEGRRFFGEVQVVNARGTSAGTGHVAIEKVTT